MEMTISIHKSLTVEKSNYAYVSKTQIPLNIGFHQLLNDKCCFFHYRLQMFVYSSMLDYLLSNQNLSINNSVDTYGGDIDDTYYSSRWFFVAVSLEMYA